MIKMIRIFVFQAFVIFCLFCAASAAYAQTAEYKEYTVRKGDTLWRISSKEISDPFLWPKIWKENPSIKNPALIYPGQTVRIPLRITQKEIVVVQPVPPRPETKRVIITAPIIEEKIQPRLKEIRIQPIEKTYLIEEDALISSGYIVETIKNSGEIIGSPNEQSLLGKGDFAYIKIMRSVGTGEKFYIFRSLGKVKHPETGDMMGYLIDIVGVLEVVGRESGEIKTRIIASYDGIFAGDLLTDFYEIEQPFLVDEPRRPTVKGFVVATRNMRILSGMMDIVYIDKGTNDGLEVGDILETMSKNRHTIPNGSIQIISLKDKTATAIVRTSQKQIVAGDPLFGEKAELSLGRPGLREEESVEKDVNLFIDRYVRIYESGDIDRFMSLYSLSAVENNSLRYDDIRRAYEKNFRDNRYSYILKDIKVKKDNTHTILTGMYSITGVKGEAAGTQTRGNIAWTLGKENGDIKIIRVDYDRI